VRLIEALRSPFLIGDGANGTSLDARGYTHQPYDLANLDAPELVESVHRDYLAAGANLIETNTFSSNPFKLIGIDVDVTKLNRAGAELARKAAGSDGLVLGAIGPSGKPIQPLGSIAISEISRSAREIALALEEGGVDGFILETFLDLDELEAAVEGVRRASKLPVLVCKAFIEDGETIAAGLPVQCARRMASWGVEAIGANCIVGPQRMLDIVRMMSEATDLPILAFPTPGMPQLLQGRVCYDASPEYFAKACRRLFEEGAKVVGGCCGTTAEHVRELVRVVSESPIRVRSRQGGGAAMRDRAPLPETEQTPLRKKIEAREFVVAVEMDVPRGLGYDKFLSAIAQVKAAGVDAINISDGARARLRMHPMAICHRIQSDVGIETVMHFACRDRNLLAIQADLLGCHSLGVRNILCVTGDPANIGDYPSATSVFDVDSIGLARILARLNEGIDLAGYGVGVKCGFTVFVAFNPMASDAAQEHDRLAQKAEAGANAIYTQPVFDRCHVEEAVEAAAKLGLPVFVGVMPLRSHRHAEFMHNEVPGIRVPDWLRKRMADAPDDASALEIGLGEACKLAELVRGTAQGLYLLPPANSVPAVERVLGALR